MLIRSVFVCSLGFAQGQIYSLGRTLVLTLPIFKVSKEGLWPIHVAVFWSYQYIKTATLT